MDELPWSTERIKEANLFESLLQYFDQCVRMIGDDPVNSHIEKLLHVLFFVEGPDKNLDPLLASLGRVGLIENLSAGAQHGDGASSRSVLRMVARLIIDQCSRELFWNLRVHHLEALTFLMCPDGQCFITLTHSLQKTGRSQEIIVGRDERTGGPSAPMLSSSLAPRLILRGWLL